MGEKELQEEKSQYKWEFAIGTTSRVPESPHHYLILDIDTHDDKKLQRTLGRLQAFSYKAQKTPNGYHIYTDLEVYSIAEFVRHAKDLGADPAWLRIGEKRGYFFLADRRKVELDWPVERMLIHYGKKKGEALNTRRT